MARRRRNDGFQSFSIIEFLTRPFRAVGRLFRGGDANDHSMRSERSLAGQILAPLTFPFRLLWAMGVFMVMSWASNRNLKAFLIGVPAIACIFGVLGSYWLANFLKEKRSVNASRAYYQMHLLLPESEPADAKMFALKLVGLKPEDQSLKYELARSHLRDDELPAALDLMEYLTTGENSYGDAHVWLANYHLNPKTVELTAEERDEVVQRNLDLALKQTPDSQEAQFAQARFHQTKAIEAGEGSVTYTAELESASENLEKVLKGPITGTQLRAIVSLIQILLELEQEDKARNVIDNVMKNVMPIARKNADISELWLTMVNCAVQLKDYELADRIIFEGLQLASDENVRKKLEQLSAEVTLSQLESLKKEVTFDSYRERLNLLCEAITENPQNHRIYLQFIDTVFVEEHDPQWLTQSAVGSRNPAVIHILIGILDLNDGNVPEGQTHWRIAEQQFARTPLIIYNFLDILNRVESEPLENLGNVIGLAIEIFPDQVLFYNARALYFQKREQFDEAIIDFLYVAKKMPQQLVVKKRLALLYEKIGKPDLARDQDDAIETAMQEFTPSQRLQLQTVLGKLE